MFHRRHPRPQNRARRVDDWVKSSIELKGTRRYRARFCYTTNAHNADLANLIAAANNIANDARTTFDQQSKFVEKMKATEHLDLERIVITSPVSAAVTYSLMDAYRIILVHEQRHFQQAKRVMEESTFPA